MRATRGGSTSIDEDLAFLDDARAARPGVRGIVIVPSAERDEVTADRGCVAVTPWRR